MPDFIKAFNNGNKPIVDGSSTCLSISYFNLVKLKAGGTYDIFMGDYESVWVVLSGNCNIVAGDQTFESVGNRKDIGSGNAESVYVPIQSKVEVVANTDLEIAVGGGKCDTKFEPFFIG